MSEATNPIVLTTIGHADPNASPITVNDLIDLLNQLITSTIQGSYRPYIIQQGAPSIDDQDKAWIELDTGGRPIALKIWYPGNEGAWRRVYNGMIGEIRGYSGVPTDDFVVDADGQFGAGKVGEEYDGWFLCNGLHGTPNLSDKFLLGGHMDKSDEKPAYDGGWVSSIPFPDGTTKSLKTGGKFIERIEMENVPLLTNANEGQAAGLWIHGYDYTGGAPHAGDKAPIVDAKFAADTPRDWNLTAGNPYGKASPDPIFTVAPFVALGWIIFKGY